MAKVILLELTEQAALASKEPPQQDSQISQFLISVNSQTLIIYRLCDFKIIKFRAQVKQSKCRSKHTVVLEDRVVESMQGTLALDKRWHRTSSNSICSSLHSRNSILARVNQTRCLALLKQA